MFQIDPVTRFSTSVHDTADNKSDPQLIPILSYECCRFSQVQFACVCFFQDIPLNIKLWVSLVSGVMFGEWWHWHRLVRDVIDTASH
jgi:hypothetical protein